MNEGKTQQRKVELATLIPALFECQGLDVGQEGPGALCRGAASGELVYVTQLHGV